MKTRYLLGGTHLGTHAHLGATVSPTKRYHFFDQKLATNSYTKLLVRA